VPPTNVYQAPAFSVFWQVLYVVSKPTVLPTSAVSKVTGSDDSQLLFWDISASLNSSRKSVSSSSSGSRRRRSEELSKEIFVELSVGRPTPTGNPDTKTLYGIPGLDVNEMACPFPVSQFTSCRDWCSMHSDREQFPVKTLIPTFLEISREQALRVNTFPFPMT